MPCMEFKVCSRTVNESTKMYEIFLFKKNDN